MYSKNNDIYWMSHALDLAQQAGLQSEVPVGAVIVRNDQILGEGWNQPIIKKDPTAHAECTALRTACLQANNHRLPGATLYVTLEPCLMCAGALVHARILRLVFAAYEPKAGAIVSHFNILNNDKLNHRVICENGVLARQSENLLRQFFRARRQ